VLVEQSGEPLLDAVERLRRLLIQHREPANPQPGKAEQNTDDDDLDDNDLMAQARAIIAQLPSKTPTKSQRRSRFISS